MGIAPGSKAVIPLLLLMSLLLGLGACGGSSKRAANKLAEDSAAAQDFSGSLTFKNVTLEQVDEQGRLLWKVKAKQARYSRDQKIARIENPTGELFQDGKLVYRITAKQGEVRQDTFRIFLQEDIVATDTQNGVVLRGKELEWLPKQDTLIVRQNVTGTHPKMQMAAQEGRLFSRLKRLELLGKIVATSKDPALQLKSERLVWEMGKDLVMSDRPIQIDRFVTKTTTDQATGESAEVNLKTKVATLRRNAQLLLTEPPLKINSPIIVWNVNQQTVASDQRLTVLHREQKVTFTANRGQIDLAKRVFYLTGKVQGDAERNQSRLRSDNLTWFISTQQVQAEGNVVYRQANPPFNLTGPKAYGKLQDQTIVVSGGSVITEFVPQ
jgi:LPS export ABC transporter protein LptC